MEHDADRPGGPLGAQGTFRPPGTRLEQGDEINVHGGAEAGEQSERAVGAAAHAVA